MKGDGNPLVEPSPPEALEPSVEFGSIEAWAVAFVESTSLAFKTNPPLPPKDFALAATPLRLVAPGRPAELEVVARSKKSPRPGALVRPEARARLLHTFWHHELQAAELFAWALLAFPETPEKFRRGLLRILLEELSHMLLYAKEIARLGYTLGTFPVRDWFWERVPSVRSPVSFLALVGLGLEAGNLDHAPHFAAALEAAGDPSAAAVEAQVGREEESHVAFALHWFEKLGGRTLEFQSWLAELPAPLTPLLFRGRTLDREARGRAGLDAAFLDALESWTP